MNDLSTTESSDLARLESIIQRTQDATCEFYEAITEIRDRKLWRSEFQSFTLYCEQKWNKSRRAINLGIEAHEVIKQVGTTGSHLTRNTALALKNMKPNLRKTTFKRAAKLAGKKPITPAHIKQASEDRPRITAGNTAECGAYNSGSTQKPPTIAPTMASDESKPLPPLPDPQLTVDFLNALYEAHKGWLNETPNNQPRLPADIHKFYIDGILAQNPL